MHFFTGTVLDVCRCQQEHNLGLHILTRKSLSDTDSKEENTTHAHVCFMATAVTSEEWKFY